MTGFSRRSLLAGMAGGFLGLPILPGHAEDVDKRPAEGGIGGTGIVGTLMDFGSLIVNGLRVETGSETAYSSTLGDFDPTNLAIGQSLTIEAGGSEDGLFARRVHVTYPLVGRAEFVDADGGRLRVAGIDVVADLGMATEIQAGERVLVSGVWRGDSVVAGRIDPAPDVEVSAIAGAVKVQAGQLAMGGRPLQLARNLPQPEADSFITVIGRATSDRFIADTLVPGRFTGAAGPLTQLSVDGYLDPTATAPRYEIAGLGHSFDETAQLTPFRDARTLFTGPYIGVFAVQTGIILPEAFDARRALIDELVADPGAAVAISAR